MPTPTPTPTSKPAGGMSRRLLHGFAVLTGGAFVTKLTNTLVQIALAWLLSPEAFGVFGLTVTVNQLIAFIRFAGLRDVLVDRGQKAHLWETPAFWLSFTMGVATSIVVLATGPIAAHVFGEPQLVGMLAVMSLVPLIDAVAVVPMTRLQRELRFNAMATINTTDIAGGAVLTVLFVLLGFDVYSFVIPRPIMSIVRLVWMYRIATPQIRVRPMFRRWRFLLADSWRVLSTEMTQRLISQMDYLVLGLFHATSVVGLYFFAFSLSMQTNRLVAQNIGNLMFPVMYHLRDDRERLANGWLRSFKAILVVGTPMALLQVAIAEPLFHLLFEPKWHPAVLLVQVLSAGMVLQITALPSDSLLRACGRFRLVMWVSVCHMLTMAVMVTLAAWLGGAREVAVAVAVAAGVYGPVRTRFVLRELGVPWRQVVPAHARILTAALLAVGAATAGAYLVPHETKAGELARLAVILAVSIPLYVLLIRLLLRDTWDDMATRLRQAMTRRRPRPAVAA